MGKKSERTIRWKSKITESINNGSFWGYFIIILLFLFVTTLVLWVKSAEPINPSVAATYLSNCAQIGATIAGFLIVVLAYIGERRFKEIPNDFNYILIFDLAAFSIAIFLFAYNSLISMVRLIIVLNSDVVTTEITSYVSESLLFIKVAGILAMAGFGFWVCMKKADLDKRRHKLRIREAN